MALQQKLSEAGWFYHAPAKPKTGEAVQVPPASQIPGLSNLGPAPPEPESMRGVIKESDSKYIRLAKKGGRQDLLKMNEFKPKSDEAVGYPQVEWYYLEDNAAQDALTKKETEWEFKLPDYMVHQQRNTKKINEECDPYDPQRLPYGWDKKTPYERDQFQVNDKTVRIQEERVPGYGVRYEKAIKHDKKQIQRESRIQSGGSRHSDHFDLHKYPAGYQMVVEDRPAMSKLLAFGYAHDAMKERQEKKEQEHITEENFYNLSTQEKNKEAQIKCQNNEKEKQDKYRKGHSKQIYKYKPLQKKGHQEENKQPWKMSKFKKVSSKTEQSRPVSSKTQPGSAH